MSRNTGKNVSALQTKKVGQIQWSGSALSLGVKRSILETDGTNENFKQSKRSKQDAEELRKAIKKKLRHLPRKVS